WAITFVDESQVVGGYANGDIRRWKIEDSQQQGPTMRAGGNIVESAVISKDGRWIVSGDRGNKAIVWSAATHEKVREFTEPNFWFSPDGSRFATASQTKGFRIYNTHSGDILFDSGQNSSSGPRIPLAWSSDGQQLFISGTGKMTCFDLSKFSSAEWLIHENQPVYIASNGKFVACAAGPSVSLWDCVSHQQISSTVTHTGRIQYVALSPSGGYLACSHG
ncbi:hypothetical protein M404DRAFT_52652, partial [Pisolithus tinctorius Marx 270]